MKKMKGIIYTSPEKIIKSGNTGLSLEFLQNAQQLLTQGFAYFDWSPFGTSQEMYTLFDEFNQFIDSSDAERYESLWEPDAVEADVGIIRRNGGDFDQKVHMNFKSTIHYLAMVPYEEAPDMIHSLQMVYDYSRDLSHLIAGAIDMLNPELSLLSRIKEAEELQTTRILKYREHALVQAQNHTDKSVFTIVYGDSIPGLVFSNGIKRFSHTCEYGKVLVFLGRKMEKYCSDLGYSSGSLPCAIPHYVEVAERFRDQTRNSLVHFVHDRTDIQNYSPLLLPKVNNKI